MSVIVLGSINTDLVVRSAHLPVPGETVLGDEFFQAGGGKGANQAVAAARSGEDPVWFVAAVGDDELGSAALASLQRENVRSDLIDVVPGVASGVALIMVDHTGQNCISVASGANARLAPEHVDKVPDEVFASSTVFLACLESPLETVARGLQRAKQRGLTTILNPAPATRELLERDLLQHVDVLTPNANEAAMLTDSRVDDVHSATAAARKLQTLGCRQVIVTLGADGCVVVGDSELHLPAMSVTAIDATAAGDAFNGVLATALANRVPLEDAARRAVVAAGLSVTRAGAQPSLPKRQEIAAACDSH